MQLHLRNLTTCPTTQSQCPTFLFFYFISSIFKIIIFRSSADFWGWFWMKGKSHKRFGFVVSKKCCLLDFGFWGFGGLLRLQPGNLNPLRSLCAPLTQWLLYHCLGASFSIFVIYYYCNYYCSYSFYFLNCLYLLI